MEGAYFYWCAWVCWIYATFLMKKTKKRTVLAAFMLVTIILSVHAVAIGPFSVMLSFLFVFFVSYCFIVQRSGWKFVYAFISMMAIAFVYASLQMFALIDPVWVWADQTWMLAILLMILCLMLGSNLSERLLYAAVGSCQGEIVYALAVKQIPLPYTVGSLSFFDLLSLLCACLIVWSIFENLSIYADAIQKQMKRNKPL
ncbi:hypothetical protein [Anoxybacteroides tepidamans]|uniref:YphA family membrane protein n=1 Tax=Anoxybacteroides tepidamans TaxID=265948 RepID=UPI0004819AB1|nr:hypothetical protein [Anoxybacillus tepidamans]